MKIRSLNEFEAALDNDFKWRKQEIITLKFALGEARRHQVDVLFRSGVVLLYAHWEGLVKFGAKAYLAYINSQAPAYQAMRGTFLFFTVRETLDSSGKVNLNNFFAFDKARNLFTTGSSNKFSADAEVHISTKENQNLTSSEFKAIIGKLGLNYLPLYELREKLIDDQLLSYRNRIAHGESLRSEIADPRKTFETLAEKILELLEKLCEQLRSSVQNKSFLSGSVVV